MAKRIQEQWEDNRIVAKSRPPAMNLAVLCLDKCFICEQSDCVKKPGDTQSLKSADRILRETWRKIKTKFQSRRSVEFSRMAKGWSTGFKQEELVATDKDHKYLNHPENICTEEPVASGYREYPGDPETPEDSQDSEPESRGTLGWTVDAWEEDRRKNLNIAWSLNRPNISCIYEQFRR